MADVDRSTASTPRGHLVLDFAYDAASPRDSPRMGQGLSGRRSPYEIASAIKSVLVAASPRQQAAAAAAAAGAYLHSPRGLDQSPLASPPGHYTAPHGPCHSPEDAATGFARSAAGSPRLVNPGRLALKQQLVLALEENRLAAAADAAAAAAAAAAVASPKAAAAAAAAMAAATDGRLSPWPGQPKSPACIKEVSQWARSSSPGRAAAAAAAAPSPQQGKSLRVTVQQQQGTAAAAAAIAAAAAAGALLSPGAKAGGGGSISDGQAHSRSDSPFAQKAFERFPTADSSCCTSSTSADDDSDSAAGDEPAGPSCQQEDRQDSEQQEQEDEDACAAMPLMRRPARASPWQRMVSSNRSLSLAVPVFAGTQYQQLQQQQELLAPAMCEPSLQLQGSFSIADLYPATSSVGERFSDSFFTSCTSLGSKASLRHAGSSAGGGGGGPPARQASRAASSNILAPARTLRRRSIAADDMTPLDPAAARMLSPQPAGTAADDDGDTEAAATASSSKMPRPKSSHALQLPTSTGSTSRSATLARSLSSKANLTAVSTAAAAGPSTAGASMATASRLGMARWLVPILIGITALGLAAMALTLMGARSAGSARLFSSSDAIIHPATTANPAAETTGQAVARAAAAGSAAAAAAAASALNPGIILAGLPAVSAFLRNAHTAGWQDRGHIELLRLTKHAKLSAAECSKYSALPAAQLLCHGKFTT